MTIEKVDLYKKEENYQKHKDVKSILRQGDLENCKSPYITIAMPTYKRADTLKYALDSALNQENVNHNYEVIVVDNDDDISVESETERLIATYKDKNLFYYKNEKNLDMFGNWNRCAELARGQWVAYLHDDDILKPDYINMITRLLKKKKDIGCILPSFNYVYNNEYPIEKSDNRKNYLMKYKKYFRENKLIKITTLDNIITNSNIYGAPTCGSIFNKEKILSIGGFNNNYYPSSDWFFMIKFGNKFKVYKTIAKLGYYRIFCNESLRLDVIYKFVSDFEKVRMFFKKKYILGKLFYYLFANEQHYNACQYFIKTSNIENYKFSIEDFNFIKTYKYNFIKLAIYNCILKIHRFLTIIKLIIIG